MQLLHMLGVLSLIGYFCAAYTTSEIDVGRVIARSLDDPRTVNKKVVVKANAFTQHELVAVWERVSGKRKKLIDVSAEEYENKNKGGLRAQIYRGSDCSLRNVSGYQLVISSNTLFKTPCPVSRPSQKRRDRYLVESNAWMACKFSL